MRCGFVVLACALSGCGGRAAAPSAVPAPSPLVAAPASTAPRTIEAIDDPACEAVDVPQIRSTIVVPPEGLARALAPVIHAACACSRPGEKVYVVATITPAAGEVTATAPEDAAADRCMQRTMVPRFEPSFELRSDCIDCGPKRFGLFPGSTEPAPPRVTLTYPFTLVHPRGAGGQVAP